MNINCDYTNDKQRRKEELAGFYYSNDLVIRYVPRSCRINVILHRVIQVVGDYLPASLATLEIHW